MEEQKRALEIIDIIIKIKIVLGGYFKIGEKNQETEKKNN